MHKQFAEQVKQITGCPNWAAKAVAECLVSMGVKSLAKQVVSYEALHALTTEEMCVFSRYMLSVKGAVVI
ncbi:MAG: hypothetical protein RLZZ347_699 [Candidatus Parcubacteria bacterium]|jgi:hypothetical protein